MMIDPIHSGGGRREEPAQRFESLHERVGEREPAPAPGAELVRELLAEASEPARAMYAHLTGQAAAFPPFPADGSDFGFCVALLNTDPALHGRVPELALLSPEWAAITKRWDELERALATLPARAFDELLRHVTTTEAYPLGQHPGM